MDEWHPAGVRVNGQHGHSRYAVGGCRRVSGNAVDDSVRGCDGKDGVGDDIVPAHPALCPRVATRSEQIPFFSPHCHVAALPQQGELFPHLDASLLRERCAAEIPESDIRERKAAFRIRDCGRRKGSGLVFLAGEKEKSRGDCRAEEQGASHDPPPRQREPEPNAIPCAPACQGNLDACPGTLPLLSWRT